MITGCLPYKMCGIRNTVGDLGELGWRFSKQKRLPGSSQGGMRGGFIFNMHQQVYSGASNHTCIIHFHHRRLVITLRNGDLHIPDHTADEHPIAPLFNQYRNVIFTCHHR